MPATVQTINAVEPEGKDEPRTEQDEWLTRAPTSLQLRQRVEWQVQEMLELVDGSAGSEDYEAFEQQLIPSMWRLGRLFVALFLCLCHERLVARGGASAAGYRRKKPRPRMLGTFFGKVRYWRTYLHHRDGGRGRYPLDEQLHLMADGFSLGLLGRAVQLATKMSFSAAGAVAASFLGWRVGTTTIEEATLGLGRYTAQWFEQAKAPEADGNILVIQLDSKGVPTAKEQELLKRRGKRDKVAAAPSPRHRGRARRARLSPKTRRKKGDKSKNAKMATLGVMFTLERTIDEEGKPLLLGPINPWRYASFAPKRHTVAIFRREAEKRGFGPGSGKLIQFVTDGDEDLARYIEELFPREQFPNVTHTLDVAHADEYLWKAGACLYREGSEELAAWVEQQKERMYAGEIHRVILEGEKRLSCLKSATKRKRLSKILCYFSKRESMMNYDELCNQDLEIGSGVVEGAVRYIISQRFDEGGMRWIRERAEALLQLRCIEINGDWERFLQFVHQRLQAETLASERAVRLLQSSPEPLPKFGLS
jgi:hypothetical protein